MNRVSFTIEADIGEIDKKTLKTIEMMGGFQKVRVINRLLRLNEENGWIQAVFVCDVK